MGCAFRASMSPFRYAFRITGMASFMRRENRMVSNVGSRFLISVMACAASDSAVMEECMSCSLCTNLESEVSHRSLMSPTMSRPLDIRGEDLNFSYLLKKDDPAGCSLNHLNLLSQVVCVCFCSMTAVSSLGFQSSPRSAASLSASLTRAAATSPRCRADSSSTSVSVMRASRISSLYASFTYLSADLARSTSPPGSLAEEEEEVSPSLPSVSWDLKNCFEESDHEER
mmetsp:Transcript_39771/g.55227  ORF Transcript_39771/g.55227 Transcript_39771/m.55227 type:complete len:228 (-) Transcript_39771:534-1217(-)